MKIVKAALPNTPATLPDDVDVRDFKINNNINVRVILEVGRTRDANGTEHLEIRAQAYEMTAAGLFKAAPLGYPSRSSSTSHTVNLSALGDTIELTDAWVRSTEAYDPAKGDLSEADGKPTTAGNQYGEGVWVPSESRVYRWTEGFSETVVRAKLEELVKVLGTSEVRSGFAFRGRRK